MKLFKSTIKYSLIYNLLILYGCDAPKTQMLAPASKHQKITITTEQNVNGKFAITLDFVQIYDQKVFEVIKGMDAKTFVQRKNQLILDNPESFAIWTFDFIANQTSAYKFPNQKNYWGIIIFLHFFDSETTRIVLPLKNRNTRLHIQDGTFTISKDNIANSEFNELEKGGNE
jgi:hypothetical protein